MKKLSALLLAFALLLSLTPARADTLGLYFGARQVYYTPGKPATLTVRAHCAGSHQGHGWETFTDCAIQRLSERREGIVFLLWGNFAINKRALIDTSKHYVLTAAHPSPLSASRGFFGCRHFSKTNELLTRMGKTPIDWQL